MSRTRKRCPHCKSTEISKIHGNRKFKSIPIEFRGIPHYKCASCKHRFFVSMICADDKIKRPSKKSHIDYTKVNDYYTRGYCDEEIAFMSKCSRGSIVRWRNANNLQSNKVRS